MRPLAETAHSRTPTRASSGSSGTGDYTPKGRAVQDVAPHHKSAPDGRYCTRMRRPRLPRGFKEARPRTLTVKQTPCPNVQAPRSGARHLDSLARIDTAPGPAVSGKTRPTVVAEVVKKGSSFCPRLKAGARRTISPHRLPLAWTTRRPLPAARRTTLPCWPEMVGIMKNGSTALLCAWVPMCASRHWQVRESE